jgi:hypothetical protein
MEVALSTSTAMRMIKKIRIQKSMIINSNNPLVQNSAAIDLNGYPLKENIAMIKHELQAQHCAPTKEKGLFFIFPGLNNIQIQKEN